MAKGMGNGLRKLKGFLASCLLIFSICFLFSIDWGELLLQPDSIALAATDVEMLSGSVEQYNGRYVGSFNVTAYCGCLNCCPSGKDKYITANGSLPLEGQTISADWAKFPLGSEIQIEGIRGSRIVEDRPEKWIIDYYDGDILDIYIADHDEAVAFGNKVMDVWLIK